MQLFGLINVCLSTDSGNRVGGVGSSGSGGGVSSGFFGGGSAGGSSGGISGSGLNIVRYSVLPLSNNSGLIGWVENCDTLSQLIRQYRYV